MKFFRGLWCRLSHRSSHYRAHRVNHRYEWPHVYRWQCHECDHTWDK